MMEIEKNLATTDLNPFKNIKEKRMAKGIIQYQNFMTKVALEKIDYTGYSLPTAKNMFQEGLRYLKTGTYCKSSGVGTLIKYIDEYKSRFVALTPKDSERRRTANKSNKAQSTSRVKQVAQSKPVTSPISVTEMFNFGIEMNGQFHKFKSADERCGFLRALKYVNNDSDIKLCHMTISYED